MEKRLSAYFRLINDFTLVMSIVLVGWMWLGGTLISPICNLEQFAARKSSCLSGGVLELRDRISIGILVFVILGFSIVFNRHTNGNLDTFNASARNQRDIGATFVVLISTTTLTYYPSFDRWYYDPNLEFSGFGFEVTFLLLFLSFVIVIFKNFPESRLFLKNFWNNNSKKLNFALSIILLTSYFPALLQPPTGLSTLDNSRYVFNDMTGLAAGNFPLADFMPHYSTLLGWPIFLTSLLFGPKTVFYSVPLLITILNFCVILLLTKLVKRIYPRIPFMIVLLGVCSLLVTSSSDLPGAFTSQSFPSWVSRMFLPSCISFVTYSFFSTTNNFKKYRLVCALGFLAFLTLVNNLEFGLTAFISISIVVLLFAMFKLIRILYLIYYVLGVILSIFVFWGTYEIAGKKIKPDFYFTISKEVSAKGYFSWPMPTFGLYILVYSMIGIALIISFQNLMVLAHDKNIKSSENYLGNLSLALFGGLWSIQCLTYYSARSVDGNLRALFVPILLALVPLGNLCKQSAKGESLFKLNMPLLLPSLLTVLIPFALLVKAPDPNFNLIRLLEKKSRWSWETTKNRAISVEFQRLSYEAKTKTGIMAFEGNSLEIVSGAKNFLLVPNFQIHKLSQQIQEASCSALVSSGVENVLVEGNYLSSSVPPCPQLVSPNLVANGTVTSYTVSRKQSP